MNSVATCSRSGFKRRNGLVQGIEAPDDLSAMRAGLAQDDRRRDPGASKLLRRDCWLVPLEAHSLWNDQAGSAGQHARDPVAGRAQNRIGRIDDSAGHTAQQLAKVVEGLAAFFRLGDQVHEDVVMEQPRLARLTEEIAADVEKLIRLAF